MEPEPEFFLTLILHHGGKFVKDDKNDLEYVGGEIDVWEGLDVDTMCLWTPSDLCKEHGYVRFHNILWHNPDFDLEKGLRPLAEDLDVRQMCNIGKVRDWEMHIYFEHPIDIPKISQKAPNDAPLSQGIQDYEIEPIVNDIQSHNAATQTVNEIPNLELPPQTVVRPPLVRPSGMVMPTASRIPVSVRAPIHTNPPRTAPLATRPGSPPSIPPPTRGVSEDTFQAASRGVQQRFMKFMPTPRLHLNPPSNK
ncbi:hypothetical protein SESBI_44377 [Sesbania bispinosa]|nr:hypothetical protein SESBI_44377 [Sesbania bispinosa]